MVLEILYLLAISCLLVYSRKKAKKLEDSVQVIERAGIALTLAKKELEEQDATIDEQAKQIEELKKQLDARKGSYRHYLEQTMLLRAELQKRTDQYNDLVDLAREKGIIGE